MVVFKNKQFVKCEEFPDTDFTGNADWVLDDNDEKDAEIEEKIISLYPNFEIVTDGSDNLIDVSETEPAPVLPAPPTDHERLEALEAAFTGFASEVVTFLENMGNLGVPLSPKLKNMFAQIKNNNLEEDR